MPDERPTAPGPVLVVRAQLGHAPSLDRLLGEVQESLRRHVALLLHDDDAAADVMQDVLLTIARKLGTLRDPRWFRAWAYRIATRAAVRYARRHRRDPESVDPSDLEQIPSELPAHRFDDELLEALLPALALTSPKSRIVLRMHYLEALSIVEVAEALEVSVGTVKSRLAYGLNALRERMPAPS